MVTGSNWYPVSSHPKKKHRKHASRLVHLPISKVFSEVCWCAHTQLFSLLSQDSLRDQIQRCAFGRSDLPLGPIDSHGYQALPKSARNGRRLKHKSTHKNSLCDFSSHMAMSETPVPQVVYPKPNPSYLHIISPLFCRTIGSYGISPSLRQEEQKSQHCRHSQEGRNLAQLRE